MSTVDELQKMEVGLGHDKAMKEFGLYEKVNKLMWCPMDCVGGFYGGEIGQLEKAGDMGTWVADAIPQETNWLAEFIASLKSKPQATTTT